MKNTFRISGVILLILLATVAWTGCKKEITRELKTFKIIKE
jgi:type III secretory pathway lipoprotein EscJ